ncbi:MAG: hypothetical protein AB7K24_18055 [Gemmataceae bacterium]
MAPPKRMTADRWRTSTELNALWSHVEKRLSTRQWQLLAAACLRHVEGELWNEEFLAGVDVLERRADSLVGDDDWQTALTDCETAYEEADVESDYKDNECLIEAVFRAVSGDYWEALDKAAEAHAWTVIPIYMIDDNNQRVHHQAELKERAAQCDLLRDIVPFKPVRIDSALLEWRDRTVVKLAQAAYEQRERTTQHNLDLKHLAILADALEEAGCTNEDVLAHLRGPGPHVRGCWSVDLLLGKE